MDLKDTCALVTGGSSGIGHAIAAALREAGATVAITGRREDRLREAADALGVDAMPGDVGVEADAKRTVDTFVERHGRIDLLVNNAGWGRFAKLPDLEAGDFEALMRTNVIGAFLMAREAARHFVAQKSGHLVNIGSTAGLKGFAGGTAYVASKFALRGMTECWRDELRRHGVRVTLINPSEVLTGFAAAAGHEQAGHPRKLRPREIADALLGALRIDDRGFLPEISVWATNPF